MRNARSGMSRRGFIGGSMTAVGALSAGMLEVPAKAFGGQINLNPSLPLDALKPMGTPDEAYWWKVRSQFNLMDGLTFMNNGTLGPVPHVVTEANVRYFREIAEDPSNGYRNPDIDAVREKVAAFVGAAPEEIALTRSTT